jgi:hypothetical protein
MMSATSSSPVAGGYTGVSGLKNISVKTRTSLEFCGKQRNESKL